MDGGLCLLDAICVDQFENEIEKLYTPPNKDVLVGQGEFIVIDSVVLGADPEGPFGCWDFGEVVAEVRWTWLPENTPTPAEPLYAVVPGSFSGYIRLDPPGSFPPRTVAGAPEGGLPAGSDLWLGRPLAALPYNPVVNGNLAEDELRALLSSPRPARDAVDVHVCNGCPSFGPPPFFGHFRVDEWVEVPASFTAVDVDEARAQYCRDP